MGPMLKGMTYIVLPTDNGKKTSKNTYSHQMSLTDVKSSIQTSQGLFVFIYYMWTPSLSVSLNCMQYLDFLQLYFERHGQGGWESGHFWATLCCNCQLSDSCREQSASYPRSTLHSAFHSRLMKHKSQVMSFYWGRTLFCAMSQTAWQDTQLLCVQCRAHLLWQSTARHSCPRQL